jgi:PIN domain nuclease of toxin-antitoxin system
MKYLLDTHALVWYFENSPKMPEETGRRIANGNHANYISSVSLWEIAIKKSLGKLDTKLTLDELLSDVHSSALTVLQIEDAYLKGISQLPPVHKDPFDRLIVATALAEGLTIITADEHIRKYDVPWIW